MECSVRDFACTLVGAAIGPNQTIFFQVGDGAIVARRGELLECMFWPESGEYANMTYFVTDELASEHLHCRVEESPAEVALLTDGLQRLALVFANQSVHTRFSHPCLEHYVTLRPRIVTVFRARWPNSSRVKASMRARTTTRRSYLRSRLTRARGEATV